MAGGVRQRYFKSMKSMRNRKVARSWKIGTFDILASCKKVQTLISSQEIRRRKHLEPSPSYVSTTPIDIVSFKDVARLSFGLTNIFSQQVDNLLEDTQHLLKQIKECGKIFEVPAEPIPTKNSKRKVTTPKKPDVMPTDRQKVSGTKELDIYCPNCYTDLLSECLEWNKIELSTEFERMGQDTSTSEHIITMPDVLYNEEPRDSFYLPNENDGFGDPTPDNIDLTIMQDLFPKSSLKRPAQDDSIDNLGHKKSRLDLNNVQTIGDCYMPPIQENIIKHPVQDDPYDRKRLKSDSNMAEAVVENSKDHDNIETVGNDYAMMPSEETVAEFLMPLVNQHSRHMKKKRKHSKLIIDECIKYSRATLVEHRIQYKEILMANYKSKFKIPKQYPNAKQMLRGIVMGIIKHKHLDNWKASKLSKNQMMKDNETTLNAICGDVNLAKEIFQKEATISSNKIPPPISSPTHLEVELNRATSPLRSADEEQERPNTALPFTLLHVAQSYLSEEEISELTPKNNNISTEDNMNLNLDSTFNVMQQLLCIWRNNPEMKEIDANELIKLSQTRLQVALIFYYLLCLSRDQFIHISKKQNSLEMDKITLGPESSRLILDISLDETCH
ncbi:uncharacterized protein c(2)M [Drosophila tropicalis]|uniref:uncharacterized protein c(2)M n=1 Tax=Drosophila tropicalis TaxID=46794 RepID=UPI0035AB95C4